MRRWLLSVVLLFWPIATRAAPLWSEDFSTITPGDIVGQYGTGNNQTMNDSVARGWSGEGACPTYYCPGAVVILPGPAGTPVHALRYRYEEGPDSDSDGTGLEVKLALETAFFPANPLGVGGGLREFYVRYYMQTQPVPPSTPACTPNCPTTSTVNSVATKQHYWRSLGESGGPTWGSFVIDYFFGSTELATAYQQATDCPFEGGIFNCPNLNQNVNHVAIDDGRWYCVEYHWKDNTLTPRVLADGVYELWIDGVPVISSTGRLWDDATHQTKLDNFMIYRQSGGFQWRFETDLVIDTQRIGCLDGTRVDAGAPLDAGASSADAGAMGGAKPGDGSVGSTGGCGCTTASTAPGGPGGYAALLAFALAALSRRVTRRRRSATKER